MTELVVTKLTEARIDVNGRQILHFYNVNIIMGARIPISMFDYFDCRDVVKPAPFEIRAGMTVQIVKEEGKMLGILVSDSLVPGKIIPTVPFVEANLLDGSHCKSSVSRKVNAFRHWKNWTEGYNINDIIDGRKKIPVTINVDERGGISSP